MLGLLGRRAGSPGGATPHQRPQEQEGDSDQRQASSPAQDGAEGEGAGGQGDGEERDTATGDLEEDPRSRPAFPGAGVIHVAELGRRLGLLAAVLSLLPGSDHSQLRVYKSVEGALHPRSLAPVALTPNSDLGQGSSVLSDILYTTYV